MVKTHPLGEETITINDGKGLQLWIGPRFMKLALPGDHRMEAKSDTLIDHNILLSGKFFGEEHPLSNQTAKIELKLDQLGNP